MFSRFTGGRRRSEIIGLLLIAGFILVLAVLLQATRLLSAVLGTCLLLLPGYLLTWSVLRARMGTAGAAAVGGAASIGMVAIGGLVLNLLPWGLQLATWLLYVVVVSAVVLATRRGLRRGLPRVSGAMMTHEAALFGLAGVVVLIALLTAQLGASSRAESYTQLWLRPAPGGSPLAIEVDIRSEEQASTAYRLELRRDGVLVQVWQQIQLTPGQLWTETVGLGSPGRAQALLFRLSDPGAVYRETTLTLPLLSPAPSTSTPPGAGN